MAENRGVAYVRQGVVQVQGSELVDSRGRQIGHGVILKTLSTNICGSDQHMVRGRTTAPTGLILGHEITGEVIELGRDVETLKVGDIVSVPFNVACGRCRTCNEQDTGVCLTVNPACNMKTQVYSGGGDWLVTPESSSPSNYI
jgi:glutathione-independent formaldehyde dehydrogenase